MLRSQLRIEEFQRLLEAEEAKRRRFSAARDTEHRVAATLAATAAHGWRLLADRRWPGSRHANVDLLHVGPGGVLVVDVKSWAEPRVDNGVLYRGEADATDEVEKVLYLAGLVEQVAAAHGLAPILVVPVIVLANNHRVVTNVGRVAVVGEPDLLPWLHRRGARLDDEQITALAAALDVFFPPHDEPAPATAGPLPVVEPVLPRVTVAQPEPLFDVAELEAALIDAACAEPIEAWMSFLHPDQVKLVRRTWHGPARLRGPAGTGKSVVGLHRAAYLAATRPGQILFTSFVKTLPAVMGGLYERLAPETAGRVEFAGLHQWSSRFLADRRVTVKPDPVRAAWAFRRAWKKTGVATTLASLNQPQDYWRDEVDHVIKARGLTDFAAYAELVRVGRRLPLQAEQRGAVWDLYQAYDAELRAEGVHDFNDLLLAALAEVRRQPVDPAYAAVIVDELQDLNRVGIELLHAIAGDGPDGLLLIGDGQQSVYPGGFTLAEAGVAIAGRAAVLRTNYRNGATILARAGEVLAGDEFDDMDDNPHVAETGVATVRAGGAVDEVECADVRAALVAAVRAAHAAGRRHGDMAVLLATRAAAATYADALVAAGVPVVRLEKYAGRTVDAVKVGTVHRAKGLEFAHVFLPLPARDVFSRAKGETDAAYADRAGPLKRQRYVAMTRARDALWLGYGVS